MSQPPSTPVKVPPSAASYTAATLDPDLRSNINARLILDGHVAKIQDHLLHALYANNANWPAALQDHALALLRSGEATTFPALLQRVLDDVRADTLAAGTTKPTNGESAAGGGSGTPSAAGKKGAATGTAPAVNGAGAAATGAAHPLAVPRPVVDETLRVTRECLEAVVDIDETAAS